MIRARAVEKRYGRRRALRPLDFELERGGFLVVTGANGSGKTTLLRLVAGLAAPTGGVRSTSSTSTAAPRCCSSLVIGGTGYLYGGIFGAIVFKLLHDVIAAWTPQYWNFWLGLFLVVLVLVGRERFVRPWTWFGAAARSR